MINDDQFLLGHMVSLGYSELIDDKILCDICLWFTFCSWAPIQYKDDILPV